MRYCTGLSALLAVCSLFGAAPVLPKGAIQPNHVAAENRHVRMLAVVPVIGTGSKGDPMRPSYLPAPPAFGAKVDPNGIIGFSVQISDDRKHALVEFVATNRAAFSQLMAD